MTTRLTVVTDQGHKRHDDFDTYGDVLRALVGPTDSTLGRPVAVLIRELADPEQIPWSEVVEGDEVLADDGSVWDMVSTTKPPNGALTFWLHNIHDGRQLGTTPRLDALVRRRPGPIAAVRQMMDDAGMATRLLR